MDGRGFIARLIRGLYLISPPPKNNSAAEDSALHKKCAAALLGGAKILQYRDKNADAKTKTRRAILLKELCQKHGAIFIINDGFLLAHKITADGVHLGAKDGGVLAARKYCGAKIIIGATCGGDILRAKKAAADGANYCALGAIFSSQTKPESPVCNLEKIGEIKKAVNLPIVAIGGINPQNAGKVFAAGADAVAVCAGVFSAKNIEIAVKKITKSAKIG